MLLKEKFISDEENESLKTKVEVIQKGLVSIGEELIKDIHSQEPIKDVASIHIDTKKIKTLIENAKTKSKKLTDSIKENKK